MSKISKEKNEVRSFCLGENIVAYLEANKIKLTAGEIQTLEGLRSQLSDDVILDAMDKARAYNKDNNIVLSFSYFLKIIWDHVANEIEKSFGLKDS